MTKISRFEDLEIWQEARELVRRVYSVVRVEGFKKDYSLSDQVKRACVSIMDNISEGFERGGNKEFNELPRSKLRGIRPIVTSVTPAQAGVQK